MGEWSVLGLLSVPALVLALAGVAVMTVSLARQKDERGEQIVSRAGLHTLIVTVAALAVCAIRNRLEPAAPKWTPDPFVLLAGIALCFAVELLYWKRRYGG